MYECQGQNMWISKKELHICPLCVEQQYIRRFLNPNGHLQNSQNYQLLIQSNWKLILSGFDVDEILEWIEQKDYEEEWERWRNECIEEDHEYAEYMNEEYCWALIDFFFSLRNMDLAEQRGYPSKFRKS